MDLEDLPDDELHEKYGDSPIVTLLPCHNRLPTLPPREIIGTRQTDNKNRILAIEDWVVHEPCIVNECRVEAYFPHEDHYMIDWAPLSSIRHLQYGDMLHIEVNIELPGPYQPLPDRPPRWFLGFSTVTFLIALTFLLSRVF